MHQPALELANININKMDNGYVVNLYEPTKYPELKEAEAAPMPDNVGVGIDPDETLDTMIDAFAAFFRHINDEAAGENWKGGDDREKLRKGFKMMFPNLAHSPAQVVGVGTVMPRNENRVFETKADLLKYLEENL